MAKTVTAKLVEFDPKLYRRYQRAARNSGAPSFAEWIRQACAEKERRDDPAAAELAREREMNEVQS